MHHRICSFILILFSLLVISCQNKDAIIISGTIDNAGNIKVVSFYEGNTKLDSVFISDGGRFTFERASTQSRLLTLSVGKNRYHIIVDPGVELKFNTDLQNPENYNVEGSELSKKLKEFAPISAKKKFIEDSLQSEFTKMINGKTSAEIEEVKFLYQSRFNLALAEYAKEAISFSEQNNNLAGFYAMNTLDPAISEAEIIAYSDKIKDDFLENRLVNEFKQLADQLRLLAIGQPAPTFEAFTPENKTIKLGDFKGQYTLIDFWASWCMPCRKENPNLVKLYNQYKEKGFTILGVSLDNNPGSWMKAITDDQLPWTQVSDLQAWSSDLVVKYKFKSIPASFLIDKEGNIIAKNLKGKDLENFLASLFRSI